MISDEKNCPLCGETIKYVAIKCKHCKANLNASNETNSINKETKFGISLDSFQKSSGDKIRVERLPMWKIFISVIIFIIFGYILFSQFQNVLTTCDNKDVISTLKKLYTDDYGHTDITLNGISTNEKNGNTRVCSAIITSSKCKSSSIEYAVRISDNNKEFTVHSVDSCGLISNFQSEINKLINLSQESPARDKHSSLSDGNKNSSRAIESSGNAKSVNDQGKRRATELKEEAKINNISYVDRVRQKLLPLVVFNSSSVIGNPAVEVEVELASDGTIIDIKVLKSSGDAGWDRAVLKAIDDAKTLPKDNDGRVPKRVRLTFKTKD